LGSCVFLILFIITTRNGVYAQDAVASSSPTLTSTPSATPQPSPTASAGTASPTPTPTIVPTSTAPTSTPQPTQESASKKEVLGEKTSVLGATNSEKEMLKWLLALGTGILTVVFCVKVLRSNGVEE